MKKDIKWLKEEVGELNLVDTVFEADGVSYIDTAVSVMQVYDLIDQLDEQEVLSHKWISDHIIFNEKEDAEYIYADELQNLIVPKQELPVVPKHVGEWITRYREKYDLYPALRLLENNTLVWGQIYEWYRENTHKFVNAFLTGEYEVEEEQKYYVIDKEDNILLIRGYGGIEKADNLKITNSGGGALKLTEQEIKNYDERFWPFAEPVE